MIMRETALNEEIGIYRLDGHKKNDHLLGGHLLVGVAWSYFMHLIRSASISVVIFACIKAMRFSL